MNRETVSPYAVFAWVCDELNQMLKEHEFGVRAATYLDDAEQLKEAVLLIAESESRIDEQATKVAAISCLLTRSCDRGLAEQMHYLASIAEDDRDSFGAEWRKLRAWFVANGFVENTVRVQKAIDVDATRRMLASASGIATAWEKKEVRTSSIVDCVSMKQTKLMRILRKANVSGHNYGGSVGIMWNLGEAVSALESMMRQESWKELAIQSTLGKLRQL